jgi:hypothetical protein
MFTGRYEPISGLGEMATPTTGESMTESFKSNWLSPFQISPEMTENKRKELHDRVTALQMESGRSEGTFQRGANWVAGMAGSILNPLSLAAGGAAGIVAKPLIGIGAGLIGRYLPSEATALLTKPLSQTVVKRGLPQSVGNQSVASLTGKAVSGYAQVTGFSLPQDVANTYDPKTDSFNWHGGIKASFKDGGVGLALMAAPYLAGTLWGKIFGREADHAQMPLPGEKVEGFNESHIDEAIAKGQWTPAQGQWFKDYAFKGDTNENLANRATQMLIKDGHPVDSATNQVMFKILHPDDVNNLQTAVSDRMANDLPENIKPLYQDFINHSRMDDLRSDPNSPSTINGLKGVVSFVRKRLAKAPEELVDFHKIVRKLLPENVKEENPFTQRKIMRGIKKVGKPSITVPEQVERRINQGGRINRLKQQNRDYQRELDKTGKKRYQELIDKNQKRIVDLSEKIQPLLTHKEEIKHLRERLLPEGNVAKNFKSTREYRRLLDLTRVRNDARRLMHEVHLKNEYELHEAYATMLDTITKVMRSEFGKLANTENINDYMRERIQSAAPQFKDLEIASVKKEVSEARVKMDKTSEDLKTREGEEGAIDALDKEISKTESSENKKEYEEIKNQYNEFKESENIFSNLIKCVLGAKNV